MITLMWVALGILGAGILAAVIFSVRAVWREKFDDAPGLIVNAAGTEDFSDLGGMPPEIAHETSPAPFPPAIPPAAERQPGTAAAAGVAPVPPPLHHDEYGPAQWFHDGPPDPAAADEVPPPALPPPPALHQTHPQAAAVGAMIAATAAHIAARERARAAELAAEARATRPWADDTGTFTLSALGLAEDPLDVPDGPLSRPLEVFHETEAGV